MADHHADAAVDIPCQVSKSTGSPGRDSGLFASRLPTEIYQMIVDHIALHYDESSNDQKAIRAKTLSSLARTSTTFQCLTEPYLYSFPEGSRMESSQGLERFQLSLAVSSRRENLVQVLDFEWDTKVYSRMVIIDIARRCPNLRTLKLTFPDKASPGDVFSQAHVDNLADLFFVCPKVKKLRISTYYGEVLPIPEQDGKIAEFAGQLSHVEMNGGGAWFKTAILPYLSPNVTSFTMIRANIHGYEDLSGFLKTLGQRCPVLERLKIMCWGVTQVEVAALCKAVGSTLKLLYLHGDFEYDGNDDGSILSQFLPHMQVLEHVLLGNGFPLRVKDMDAMSSLSHLRTFIAEDNSYNESDSDDENEPAQFFRGETLIDVDRALVRFLSTHRTTLETMWLISCDCDLGEDVFQSLKLVRNLRSVGMDWNYEIGREEVDALLEACPKLRGAPDIENYVDEMFGVEDEWKSRYLWIVYDHLEWFENDYPQSDTGWAISLRQPQRSID
ncbi:hypothetical protein F52700_5229 [Fusarium sp. NRRL 52700]|nr:hypothetical protein F52700_5229 [Fusarium sp. NRRL 52700]